MTFTSKKDSSKSIFVPALGGAENGLVTSSGVFGCVWSSMLATDKINGAVCLGIAYLFIGVVNAYSSELRSGLSIRGVIDG